MSGTDDFKKATKAAKKEQGGKRYKCSACDLISPTPLFGCTRCRIVAYCNRECQKKHWPDHKVQCNLMQKHTAILNPNTDRSYNGHNPGRVHPMDAEIRKHAPVVYNDGVPHVAELTALMKGKRGKRIRKILPKLLTQNAANEHHLTAAEKKKEAESEFTILVEGWKYPDEKKQVELAHHIFFSMLVHNPGAPQTHSLHEPDSELLLEFYWLWGGDLAQRYELDGRGLIHLTAVEGLTHSMKWLVAKGVDPNQSTSFTNMGMTSMSAPLHLAIMHGRLSALQKLCAMPGIDIDRRNMSGRTPLLALGCSPGGKDEMSLDDGRADDATVQAMLDALLLAGADPKALIRGCFEKKAKTGNEHSAMHVTEDGMNLADMALASDNRVVLSYCMKNKILPTGKMPPDGTTTGGEPQCPVS